MKSHYMRKNDIIFLTSTGLSDPKIYNKFVETVGNTSNKKAVVITTAAQDKDRNKYSQLAMNQLLSMGFLKVNFCDLENERDRDLSSYDVIYVCGGNTFKLLKFARVSNFKESVEKLLERGGIYVGVSAGSIILGPSIKIAEEIHPDINDVQLNDLSAFSIIDFTVMVHYSEKLESEVMAFEKKEKIKVERLTNEQAIIIDGNYFSRI